ncbi:MAG: CbrC family protein [Candidatus Lokiarchaeota archaeon]|nr:CbrC family protein [Candidatus Lokiarchaeota archaeon]
MSKQLELPQFKYLPNAYDLGIFNNEKFVCDICNTEQEYRYVGPFYMEKEKSNGTIKVTNSMHKICPWCIQNGKAAEILDADFKDIDILEQTCYKEEYIEQECDIRTWLDQTPNFQGFETELWPICCHDFTAFIGYLGGGEKVSQNLNLVKGKDLSKITATLEGKSVAELFLELENTFAVEAQRLRDIGVEIKNGTALAERLKKQEDNAVGYLFRCLGCGKYFVHVDFTQKP